MKVQKCENSGYKQSFGTYLGANIQDKILLCQKRNMFTPERIANLMKIEDDGLDAVLDIYDTLDIRRTQNNKALLTVKKYLTLNKQGQKTIISKMEGVIEPTSDNKKSYFRLHKFIKFFDNEFNLADKIQKIAQE